jgi:glutaredoxin-related protein
MKKNFKYLLFIWPLLILFSSACVKNETCISANNLLMINLYEINSDTTAIETQFDSLTLYFKGREDSLIYDNAKSVKSIDIPLSDTTENLKIVIKINDGYDEIILQYKPYSVFRSTECGVIYRYEIIDFTYTTDKIAGILLENELIDENEAVNLNLFVNLE